MTVPNTSIDLNDAGFTGYSSIEGGHISGKLESRLTLVQDGLGAGGELTLTIDEHVAGAIVVPVVKDLTIGGDLSANITVSDELRAPGLDINGNVEALVVISIASWQFNAHLEIGAPGLLFKGQVVLLNGLSPSSASLTLFSDLTSSASINLNNGQLSGSLACLGDNAGSIINVFWVKNALTLASGAGNAFSGTATVAVLLPSGFINTTASADLTGRIYVAGDVLNTISVAGDLGSDALISVGDDLTGPNGEITINGDALGDIVVVDECTAVIQIDGDLFGDVDLQDAFTGSVTVDGSLRSTGRILVDFISVGSISIGEATEGLSLIHLKGGLHEFGTVEINRDQGNFNAGGTIHVGPTIYFGPPPPPITFDGCIRIYDNGQPPPNNLGGDLKGALTVVGCHALPLEDLNICIDGNDNGNVTIEQTNCSDPVDWSCGGCP